MKRIAALLVVLGVGLSSTGAAFAKSKPPYWASIAASEARLRTGPGRQFPASWLYQRAQLPVKVIATYPNWRKIEDPDGTQGWIQANLLSDDRTALVKGEVRPLRDRPNSAGKIIFRAEPGVVGKISECGRGWCKLDVKGRMGYIEASQLWGVDAAEMKP